MHCTPSPRDKALKDAAAQAEALARDRNDAIAKFNDLAAKYNAAVEEIKKANTEIQQLAADRNEAVAKFNDLAAKYNVLVKETASPSTKP
jgi:uncharacterized coiled-coil DUF342 family protein